MTYTRPRNSNAVPLLVPFIGWIRVTGEPCTTCHGRRWRREVLVEGGVAIDTNYPCWWCGGCGIEPTTAQLRLREYWMRFAEHAQI